MIVQKKLFRISYLSNLTNIRVRGRWYNIAFIIKILQMYCGKRNSNIFRKLFQREKVKKAKRPKEFFNANQLEVKAKRPNKIS